MLAGYCPYSACIDRRHIALYGELIDRIGILVENKLEEYKLSGSVNLIKSNELGRGEGGGAQTCDILVARPGDDTLTNSAISLLQVPSICK